jgi:DNA repair protein RecO (recombination protein O)
LRLPRCAAGALIGHAIGHLHMPVRETEAIVLRTYRLGEADKIISLFSRQFGRIRAAATGAQRPKSRYGGLLEPLSYIRLWLFERENRQLFRVNSAELLESFFGMQSSYRVQLAVQYMAEAAERLLPEREINERAFRLYLAVLRGLKATSEIDRPLLYFNYWLLRLGGFLPALGQCVVCARPLSGQSIYYGQNAVGFTCADCKRIGSPRGLSAGSLAVLEVISKTPLERWLASERSNPLANELRHALEAWLELSAEKKLVTLQMLAESSAEESGAPISLSAVKL